MPQGRSRSPGPTGRRIDIVVLLVCALWALVMLAWSLSPGEAIARDSPLRIVLGGLFVMVLPGLIWAEVLRFRSRQVFETIALATAMTLVLHLPLLIICFLFGWPIVAWALGVIAVCLSGLAVLIYRWCRGGSMLLLRPRRPPSRRQLRRCLALMGMTIVIVALSVAAYRWGETLRDISGEKLLHLTYVRMYAELPLRLADIGLMPNQPPPNLVHLWEFFVAGWARMINVDPIVVFHRARFLVPLLAMPAMYLLIAGVTPHRRRAEAVFLVILLLAAGGAFLLGPGPLDWVRRKDPTRWAFCFLESAHHADVGMGVLLPLLSGVLLWVLRRFHWGRLLLVLGLTAGVILWHPREFFQVSVVWWGVLGVVLLIGPMRHRRRYLGRWVVIAAISAAAAAGTFGLSKVLVPRKASLYPEMEIKAVAIRYAFAPSSLAGVRNPFNFPMRYKLSGSAAPEQIQDLRTSTTRLRSSWTSPLWLLLSAGAVGVLGLLGGAAERRLGLYYVLLWFLVLCWNTSMLLLLAATYSEIFVTTPRMLHVPAYLVIGFATATLAAAARRRLGSAALTGAVLLPAGLIPALPLGRWWSAWGKPGLRVAFWIAAALMLVATVAAWARRPHRRPWPKGTAIWAGAAALLFLAAAGPAQIVRNVRTLLYANRASTDLFARRTELGISQSLRRALRGLEGKRVLLVDPLGTDYVGVYAPHYVVPWPRRLCGTVGTYRPQYETAQAGRFPLFNPAVKTASLRVRAGGDLRVDPDEAVQHKELVEALEKWGVMYLLVRNGYYEVARRYVGNHPELYRLILDRPGAREMLVQYIGGRGNVPAPGADGAQ